MTQAEQQKKQFIMQIDMEVKQQEVLAFFVRGLGEERRD